MAFSEVRDYQIGDEIRTIDWNVTARFNHPYVKVFEEEREMTVMLLVDVSGSKDFGSQKQFKQEMDAAQATYEFIAYPEATHSFTSPEADSLGAAFNMPVAYNPTADAQSWDALQNFFKTIFE